jgi:small subunit ribosomal protein S16
MGATHRPFYRMIAIHSKNKRDGSLVEELGWYNPSVKPRQINLKSERIRYWISTGAQVAVGARSVLAQGGILDKIKVEGPKRGEKRRKLDKLTKAEKRAQAQTMVEQGDKKEAAAEEKA